MKALIGRKIGMSHTFLEDGRVVPVTAIEAGPCTVVQVKTPEKEGYAAVQLGFEEARPTRLTQPMAGHFAKGGIDPKRVLREVRVPSKEIGSYSPGQEIRAEGFEAGDVVDVIGTSKGRGTAGVMRRWGFSGAKASHGVHEFKRHGGTAGMGTYPGRTPKGFKMPGRMGNRRVTAKNLEVVRVIPEKNVILIRGSVPGHRRSLLLVQSARTPKKKGAPDKAG